MILWWSASTPSTPEPRLVAGGHAGSWHPFGTLRSLWMKGARKLLHRATDHLLPQEEAGSALARLWTRGQRRREKSLHGGLRPSTNIEFLDQIATERRHGFAGRGFSGKKNQHHGTVKFHLTQTKPCTSMSRTPHQVWELGLDCSTYAD